MYSPEAGQPATPAAAPTPNDAAFELDHDAVLADASDETWGVLLSHCLNNSYSLIDLRPALRSGYLVKWKGAIEQDGYALLGVNVIWVEKNEKGLVEQVLRDVLRDFRGLSILTKAKGMVAGGRPEEGVLPWHVATVVKGVRALSYVL
jgi:mediator of RNA polymerase II transcription subunit 13, fungi type